MTVADSLSMEARPLTFVLREVAMNQVNVDVRYVLRGAADSLDKAVIAFANNPNEINLREVNGLWAYSVRVLTATNEAPQPSAPLTQANAA